MKTPRTDAAIVPVSSLNAFSEIVPAAFAQGLEAELTKLARLDWRLVAAGLPTEEDADEFGDVEWSDGHDIWQAGWARSPHQPTHWRTISLPPLIKP